MFLFCDGCCVCSKFSCTLRHIVRQRAYVIYDAIIYSKRPLLRLRPLPSNNELSAVKAHSLLWCMFCVAVILLGAVLSFPVGLDSKLAQHYCPGARMYSAGSCQVGWAYMLGIMSAALVVFCPVLSHYTDIDDDLEDCDESEVIAGSSTVRLIA